MEGFAVALACAHMHTPLSIVRGISNQVGDRDSTRWKIPAALHAARLRAWEELEKPQV
jgi:futalosine hydrolase